MNKRRVPFALIVFLFLPFLASGQTVQASCPNLSRNLSLGSGGADVASFQNFLISQNLLPQDDNTGYFGRLTKAAAIQFQLQQSLPSTGLVGPLTRAAIAKTCSQTTNTVSNASGNFSVTPGSGTAPLAVTLSYSNLDPKDMYKMDFGDNSGAQSSITMDCTTSSACTGGSVLHTYTSAGVYLATLNKENNDFVCAHYPCDPPGASVVGSELITVGGTPSSSATIDPSSLTPSSSSITLRGTDSNPHTLWVDVVNARYTGPTDYFSLMNNGGEETGACGSERNISECGQPTSSNGNWSEQVDVTPGIYHVYVFDMSTHLLLASGTFNSSNASQ